MVQFLVMAFCVWSWLTLLPSLAQGPLGKAYPPYIPRLAVPGQPIAGIPYEEALKIYARYQEELRQLPGAVSVNFTADGLVVETKNPAALPAAVEGLPVVPISPVTSVETLPKPDVSAIPLPESQTGSSSEPAQDCGSEAHWDAKVGRCRRNVPLDVPPPQYLPPPPGVIVLRPGGVREHQDSCPPPFEKVVEQGGWRFCVNPSNPEPIPPLMVPPIAGIPYEEAEQILERHKEELMHLPGVGGFGLGADGIEVETDNPAVVPRNIEGLPIKTRPRVQRKFLNHTVDQPLRPLHGAAAIGDSFPNGIGTLTGVVLSQGRPWLVFPAHILGAPLNPSNPNSPGFCSVASICPPPSGQPPPPGASILNSCSHYLGTDQIFQPWVGSTMSQRVGFVPRWDPDPGNTLPPSSDVGAAFMDSNVVEGDGSLTADRAIERSTVFTGEGTALMNSQVFVVSSDPGNTGIHVVSARVTCTSCFIQSVQNDPCVPGSTQGVYGQLQLQAIDFCFAPGDSGSPVVNQNGSIVGMFNWAATTLCDGGGTNAVTIKRVLGFDAWYGTNTSDLKAALSFASRSVQINVLASVFATVTNTSSTPVTSAQIAMETPIPAAFIFQATSPVAAGPNVAVNIPGNSSQTFAIGLLSSGPIPPTEVFFNFFGFNGASPLRLGGANSLFYSANSQPTLDILATAVTPTQDGTLVLTGNPPAGAFAVATLNNGTLGTVTVVAEPSVANLLVSLYVCETNPSTGVCLAPIAPSVSVLMGTGSTRSFGVFAFGTGSGVTIADKPAVNRIYARFRDSNNAIRGNVGVAVHT